MVDEKGGSQISSILSSGLNRHGHAFQYRVMKEIHDLFDAYGRRGWKILAVEMPVGVGGRDTRIDFVVELRDGSSRSYIMIAECKRVNPAFSWWAFAQAPYTNVDWAKGQVIPEGIVSLSDQTPVTSGVGVSNSERCYQLGYVMKSGRSGDPQPVSSDKDAVEAACSQVMTGMNGFIETVINNPPLSRYLSGLDFVYVLPVVFTTADLLATDADLRGAELSTGEIELDDGDVKRLDWLFLQYTQSPVLKHGLSSEPLSGDTFANVVGREYVRSVAVVGPAGIRDFLQRGWVNLESVLRQNS